MVWDSCHLKRGHFYRSLFTYSRVFRHIYYEIDMLRNFVRLLLDEKSCLWQVYFDIFTSLVTYVLRNAQNVCMKRFFEAFASGKEDIFCRLLFTYSRLLWHKSYEIYAPHILTSLFTYLRLDLHINVSLDILTSLFTYLCLISHIRVSFDINPTRFIHHEFTCVFIYIYIYICIRIYIYIYMYIYILDICIDIYIYICMYIYMYVYTL